MQSITYLVLCLQYTNQIIFLSVSVEYINPWLWKRHVGEHVLMQLHTAPFQSSHRHCATILVATASTIYHRLLALHCMPVLTFPRQMHISSFQTNISLFQTRRTHHTTKSLCFTRPAWDAYYPFRYHHALHLNTSRVSKLRFSPLVASTIHTYHGTLHTTTYVLVTASRGASL